MELAAVRRALWYGVCLALLWPALLCAGRNLGVVVGIADYPSGISDLKYTDDDAIAVWTSLVSDSGWAEQDIILLLDSAATKENIATFIEQHASGMAEGDTFLFYFAGHGTVGIDLPPLDEDDGLDEYLCLYGASTEEFLRDDELVALFAPCGAGTIVVVLDNCYSGGQFGAVRSINTASAPDEHDGFADDLARGVRGAGSTPKDLVDLTQPIVALAACGEAEYSWELGAPKSHGLFTYYFLEGLQGRADSLGDRDGRVTAEECFAYCAPRVEEISVAWGLNQHPEMLDLLVASADLVESQVPTAAFDVEQTREPAPSLCVFDPSASCAATGLLLTSFAWDFGDGASLVQTSPVHVTHVYATASEREEFEVRLTVEDDTGETDTTRTTVVATNCQPLAGFEWRAGGETPQWVAEDILVDTEESQVLIELRSVAPDWTVLGAGQPYSCASAPANYADHNLSYDPEGQGSLGDGWGVAFYEVDFGDGVELTIPAGAADGCLERLSHTYSLPCDGLTDFALTVTAVDELGGSGSWTRRLSVRSGADGCDETCVALATPGWSMIALAGAVCGACMGPDDLECALCDDLDPCLLFQYLPVEGRYVTLSRDRADPYTVGTGLWVYADAPAELCLMTTARADVVPVVLRIGWNQIGNPFPFPVGLNDLRVTYEGTAVSLEEAEGLGWVRMYLFGYDRAARSYTMMTPLGGGELGPFEGYWLLAHVECELLIPPVPSQGLATEQEWRIAGSPGHIPQGVPSPPAPPVTDLKPASVLNGLLIKSEPNPVRSQHTTTFKVMGSKSESVSAIRVEIYDLSGQLVWSEEAHARELAWHTDNQDGELLANGVYLYRIWVKVGDTWLVAGTRKVAVIR